MEVPTACNISQAQCPLDQRSCRLAEQMEPGARISPRPILRSRQLIRTGTGERRREASPAHRASFGVRPCTNQRRTPEPPPVPRASRSTTRTTQARLVRMSPRFPPIRLTPQHVAAPRLRPATVAVRTGPGSDGQTTPARRGPGPERRRRSMGRRGHSVHRLYVARTTVINPFIYAPLRSVAGVYSSIRSTAAGLVHAAATSTEHPHQCSVSQFVALTLIFITYCTYVAVD